MSEPTIYCRACERRLTDTEVQLDQAMGDLTGDSPSDLCTACNDRLAEECPT